MKASSSVSGIRVAGLVVAVILAALVQLTLLWGTELPLGVPREWTWERIRWSAGDWWNLWPALLSGLAFTAFVAFAAGRMKTAPPRFQSPFLLGLWGLGMLWMFSQMAATPGIAGLSRTPFVLFYTRSSGYFTQAREVSDRLPEFLQTYQERIQDSNHPENYLHLGTHPPGLTTAFVVAIDLCERFPRWRSVLLATQPAAIRQSSGMIAANSGQAGSQQAEVDAAVLWLATLITVFTAAGTCVPLFLLARRHVSSQAAWWTAAAWLLVPATVIFLPKSDTMFPCLAMGIQWTWLHGLSQRSFCWGLAAGTLMFLALCLTLAFAPLGLILVLQGLLVRNESKISTPARPRFRWGNVRWRLFSGAGTAFGMLLTAGLFVLKLNLPAIWIQNLRNHAAFYSHATRTYWAWLPVNIVELAGSIGTPLALLAICGLWTQRKRPWNGELLIPVAVWTLLWISGKNMGEAARLWIFLMPYAVWLISRAVEQSRLPRRVLVGIFVIQQIVCLATVIRIDGFHFAELLP